uniref:Uncharacterized protein n=1 Tax=Myotis myotis TaxID=51298 RepID=A0A7J7UPN8_MYOMY|nr:hypothetical protein mMyoMyo1_008662 [Myotis myotis]
MSLKFSQVEPPVGTRGIPYSGILHTRAESELLPSACPGDRVNPVCSLTRPVRCEWDPAGLLGLLSTFWMPLCPQALLLMPGPAAIAAAYRNIDLVPPSSCCQAPALPWPRLQLSMSQSHTVFGQKPSSLPIMLRPQGPWSHRAFSEETHMVFTSLTLP